MRSTQGEVPYLEQSLSPGAIDHSPCEWDLPERATYGSLTVEIENISGLETALLDKGSQGGDLYAGVRDSMKRVRAAVKGSQYEMVGGYRLRNEQPPEHGPLCPYRDISPKSEMYTWDNYPNSSFRIWGRQEGAEQQQPMPPKTTTPKTMHRAGELRKQQTEIEAKLWARLRAHRMGGVQFRRQHAIGKYIVDFSPKGDDVRPSP